MVSSSDMCFDIIRTICDWIKQSESEVGKDILLISDQLYTPNRSQENLKPDTCEAKQFIRYM